MIKNQFLIFFYNRHQISSVCLLTNSLPERGCVSHKKKKNNKHTRDLTIIINYSSLFFEAINRQTYNFYFNKWIYDLENRK